jgi:hypothetical protein
MIFVVSYLIVRNDIEGQHNRYKEIIYVRCKNVKNVMVLKDLYNNI